MYTPERLLEKACVGQSKCLLTTRAECDRWKKELDKRRKRGELGFWIPSPAAHNWQQPVYLQHVDRRNNMLSWTELAVGNEFLQEVDFPDRPPEVVPVRLVRIQHKEHLLWFQYGDGGVRIYYEDFISSRNLQENPK